MIQIFYYKLLIKKEATYNTVLTFFTMMIFIPIHIQIYLFPKQLIY